MDNVKVKATVCPRVYVQQENKGSNYLHYTPSVVVNVMSWFLFQLNQLNPFDDVLLVSFIINTHFFVWKRIQVLARM